MERATTHAERILKMHNPAEGWTLVTAASHPNLFEMFETISHDAGFGAGHDNYSVPTKYTPRKLVLLEAQASTMGKELKQEFAIGGDDPELERLRGTMGELHSFLDDFFEDWSSVDAP